MWIREGGRLDGLVTCCREGRERGEGRWVLARLRLGVHPHWSPLAPLPQFPLPLREHYPPDPQPLNPDSETPKPAGAPKLLQETMSSPLCTTIRCGRGSILNPRGSKGSKPVVEREGGAAKGGGSSPGFAFVGLEFGVDGLGVGP